MSKSTQQAIQEELKAIRDRNAERKLKVAEVVEFAKDPTTALHGQFNWDDSQAAHAYRLWQAREVVQRYWVTIEKNGKQIDAPIWVSIDEDRKQGGGYREFEEVRADPVQYQLCLNTALRELEPWRKRFESIQALSPVFRAIDRVAKQDKPKAKTQSAPARKKATKRPRVGA